MCASYLKVFLFVLPAASFPASFSANPGLSLSLLGLFTMCLVLPLWDSGPCFLSTATPRYSFVSCLLIPHPPVSSHTGLISPAPWFKNRPSLASHLKQEARQQTCVLAIYFSDNFWKLLASCRLNDLKVRGITGSG